MINHVGVIAEDDSDVDVIKELIKKIVPDKKFTLKSFVGHGCGKIQGKCFEWANDLKNRGCSILILVHDLDEKKHTELHSNLCKKLKKCAIPNHIVIVPIREIESWLLSDSLAIQRAMNLSANVDWIANPETIIDPKRKLTEIIYLRSGKTKRYINTVDNQKIASQVDVVNIRRCNSFLPLEAFVQQYIK